jgi:hypothetical protein
VRPRTLIRAGQAALLAERATLASWRGVALAAAIAGVCLAIALPPAWAVLAFPLLAWDLARVRLPAEAEGARLAERPASHRPLSALEDPRAGGDRALWSLAVQDKQAVVAALPLPWPRPTLASADPRSLRLAAALIFLAGSIVALGRGGLSADSARAPEKAGALEVAPPGVPLIAAQGQTRPSTPSAGLSPQRQTPDAEQMQSGGLGQRAQVNAGGERPAAAPREAGHAGGDNKQGQKGTARSGQEGQRRPAERGNPDKDRKGQSPVPVERAALRRPGEAGLQRAPPAYDPLGRPVGPEHLREHSADDRALPRPAQRLIQTIEAELRARLAQKSPTEAERAYYGRLLEGEGP